MIKSCLLFYYFYLNLISLLLVYKTVFYTKVFIKSKINLYYVLKLKMQSYLSKKTWFLKLKIIRTMYLWIL